MPLLHSVETSFNIDLIYADRGQTGNAPNAVSVIHRDDEMTSWFKTKTDSLRHIITQKCARQDISKRMNSHA